MNILACSCGHLKFNLNGARSFLQQSGQQQLDNSTSSCVPPDDIPHIPVSYLSLVTYQLCIEIILLSLRVHYACIASLCCSETAYPVDLPLTCYLWNKEPCIFGGLQIHASTWKHMLVKLCTMWHYIPNITCVISFIESIFDVGLLAVSLL